MDSFSIKDKQKFQTGNASSVGNTIGLKSLPFINLVTQSKSLENKIMFL